MEINKKDVNVIIGFDTETNMGNWDNSSYSGTLEGTPRLLDILDRKKVKTSFFIQGELAGLCPEFCKEILNRGHDVGCHSLYHEVLGDFFYPVPGIKPLFPEELFNRMNIATDLITKAVGERPVTFRCPNLWGGTDIINVLEKLGYIADATYNMYHYSEQLVPYHPSKGNWLEKGDMKILEIPNFADVTVKMPNSNMAGIEQWPIFRTVNAEALMVHVKNFINFVKNKDLPIVVCFYFHPWEFSFTPSKFRFNEGYTCPDEYLYKNTGGYALKEFEKLIDYLKNEKAIFYTAKEFAMTFDF